jgi:hypothetical protein
MSNWLLCAALAALPVWAGGRETPLPVALYTHFQHLPDSGVVEAIQNEVHAIMAPMGQELEWRSLDEATGSEVASQLAVIKFVGRCSVEGRSSEPVKGALGWTHISDGVILPFTDIDCDGIRNFLETALMGINPRERAEAYGHAVGRVLAHELYHIFANTTHHGSSGVAKSVYTVRDLLSRDFLFQERESDALRSNQPRPAMAVDATEDTHRL